MDNPVTFEISDGYSNVERHRTIPTTTNLKLSGTTIYAIGVGHKGFLDPNEINGLANDPDYQYGFIVPNVTTIDMITDSILNIMCAT